MIIVGNLETVESLIQNCAAVNLRNKVFKSTPLHIAAARKDNAEIVKILIKSGAHVDALNSEGNSAFTVATDSGSFEVANLLKDATSESDNRRDCNALHEAVIKNNIEDVRKLLIDHDVDGVNNEGDTPLILAVTKGNKEIVEELLDYGADVNCLDDNQATTPHLAIKNGHAEIFQLLINNGAYLNFSDWNKLLREMAKQKS